MSAPSDVTAFLNALLEAKRRNDPHFGRLAIQNFINGSIVASSGRYDAVTALTWVLFEALVPNPDLARNNSTLNVGQPTKPAASPPQQNSTPTTPAATPAAASASPQVAQPAIPARMNHKEFLFYAKASTDAVGKWLKLIGRSQNNPFTPKDITDYHAYRHQKRVAHGKKMGSMRAAAFGKKIETPPETSQALIEEFDVPEDDVPGMLGPHWDYKQFKLQVLWQGGKHYNLKPEARMIHGKPFYRRADILAFKQLINAPQGGESNVAPVTEERIKHAEDTIQAIKKSIK